MPFDVFRRHQRKMMGGLAILAMFSFVLADSLPNLLRGRNGPGGTNDPVLAVLYGKGVRASDLQRLLMERQRANYFVGRISPRGSATTFGGTSTRELVDAYILEKEADRLGLPADPQIANSFLRQMSGGLTNASNLAQAFRNSALSEQITDEQLLLEIANQIRIQKAATLPVNAEATPLDVFDAYRAQNEKVSAFAVPFKVEDYVARVGTPTPDEKQALYEKFKATLPDPDSADPGFMVPQQVRFEVVSANVRDLANQIRSKLTDDELREIYEVRRSDFLAAPPELPVQLFAGFPDAIKHDAFPEVRVQVREKVADERALEEINTKLEDFRNETLLPFQEKYAEAVANKEEPSRPGDLMKSGAAKLGMTYDATPLISRYKADEFGDLGRSRLGIAPFGEGQPFLTMAFSGRSKLFEPLDFVDDLGHRFLVWMIRDDPARVPTMAEVETEVDKAWKMMQARPRAEQDAQALADAASKAGGGDNLKSLAEKRQVIETDPRSKMSPAPLIGLQSFGRPQPTPIPELTMAGDDIRDAIFHLTPKSTLVAGNEPKTIYYALSLHDRNSVELDGLYSFATGRFMTEDVNNEIAAKRIRSWMSDLRARAGLAPDWAPPNEGRNDTVADAR